MTERVKTAVITGRRMNGSERFIYFGGGTGVPPVDHAQDARATFKLIHYFVAAGLFAFRGCSIKTLPPGVTPSCPLVTTRSPACTPVSTTTRSPCRWPNDTARCSAVESCLTT